MAADAADEVPDQRDRESRKQDQALDSLTDVVEEVEFDAGKVQKAMAELMASQKASMEEQRQRERELAAVKVQAEDVNTIAVEFELDKKTAERRLREHRGDVVATLQALLEA